MSVEMHDGPKRGRGRPKGTAGKKKDIHADRKYQHVRQLYLSGLNYEEIGAHLGVSRQRIEQMVRRLDLVPQRKRMADRRAIVAGTIVRKGLTSRQAMAMFDCSAMYVYVCCREHGIEPAGMTAEERREFDTLALQVKNGSSIRQAAEFDAGRAQKLSRFLKKAGIETKGRSRHDNFDHRYDLIEQWRRAGKTWRECAELMSAHDGRKIGWGALSTWAHRYMPHLFERNHEVTA